MKTMHLTISGLCAAALVLGFAPRAYAFHSGGVAECVGCHTPHNGSVLNNNGGTNPGGTSGPYLLLGRDQSSTCLNCHQHAGDTQPSSYHVSTAETDMTAGTAPLQRTPGGDFGWLKKTYSYSCRGTFTNAGQSHGHNIVALDYGYVADTVNTTAPGGTYDANKLGCTSCHDPHNKYRRTDENGTIVANAVDVAGLPIIGSGSYTTSAAVGAGGTGYGAGVTWGAVGVYRILGGNGYAPKSYGAAFTAPNPIAIAPATYNRSEGTSDTRVAYGQGMAEWCANCHGEMHSNTTNTAPGDLVHPAGNGAKLSATVTSNYNHYVKSGDLSGGQATSYESLVPYEEGITNVTTLKANATPGVTTGPSTGTENVMCLSCHRAHASGFEYMTRWFMENEFMTIAAGGTTGTGTAIYANPTGTDSNGCVARGLTATEQQAAYYDRPATHFAPYQRSLCNKCHAKD